MPLPAGTRFGPYEIVAALGAGGMGEVYRARDARLGRDVAVKILPPDVAGNPDRLGRFENEARAAAALNHPNILAVHDVGTENGVAYIVAELVDGQTLRHLLDEQTISVSRTIDLAGQIADGLSAAHARGLIHRDLKPENVIVTPEGRAKILDFGLAKSVDAGEAGLNAPTRTGTAPHMVLGTIGYMSPEQVKGQPIDHRSDVFAFGCVLYEMMAGRRAFGAGDSAVETMSAMLRETPAPPASTPSRPLPPALLRIVDRCLEKSPAARFQSTTDLAFALKSLSSADSGATGALSAIAAAPAPQPWTAWLPWSVAAACVLGTAAIWFASRGPLAETTKLPLVRVNLSLPNGVGFSPNAPISPFPALSPDGRYLVMVLHKGTAGSLWLRTMSGLETRELPGTTNGTFPFWSPDSRSIGFFASGKVRRIDIDTGVIQDIADANVDLSNPGGGGAWAPDGTIIAGQPEGLMRVPAIGGTASVLTTLDAGRHEISHRHPTFLPDGRHFLFQVSPERAIWIGSLDEPATSRLLSADSKAVYVPPGWLLFVRQNTLLAQRFDALSRQLQGEPITVVNDVRTAEFNGRSAFTASENGVLVYRGEDQGTDAGELTWVDRSGKPVGTIKDQAATYNQMELVPGELSLIAHIHEEDRDGGDLWTIDLERGSRVRMISARGHDQAPLVSPDGSRLAWTSDRSGKSAIYQKPVVGPGDDRPWIELDGSVTASGLSANWVVFTAASRGNRSDIWVAPVADAGKRRPYLETEYSESQGRLSPNERWMAYQSDESGNPEVYVRPFPDAGAGVWRISGAEGGFSPRWRADGGELFYFTAARLLMSVTFDEAGARPAMGRPQSLFQHRDADNRYLTVLSGRRFLMSRRPAVLTETPVTVVANWMELVAGK